MQDPGINSKPVDYRCGSLANPKRFNNQDFDSLRNYLLSTGQMFHDDTFPANNNIIGPKLVDDLHIQNLEWKRPVDICKHPHIFVDGASLFDMQQRGIGDCWVLSTMGALALQQKFLWNIVPLNQGYSTHYAGIFHFRFWHFGDWVDVVIDDQLPFLNKKYLSVQPSSHNEFWPCLLEKAYAKLQGSYQNLHWGDPSEAFVNFSGGVAVEFNLRDHQAKICDIWRIARLGCRNALMGATTGKQASPIDNRRMSVPHLNVPNETRRRMSAAVVQERTNTELQNGLILSHAYTVTGTAEVHHEKKGLVHLIRMWNPWGQHEWNGPWSDNSREWDKVKLDEQKQLHQNKDNGEFWMPWGYFTEQFSNFYICNHVPDFLDFEKKQTPWYKSMFFGHWSKQSTETTRDTLWMNPQYIIRVTEKDEVKTGQNVVVCLMQNPEDRPKFISTWRPIGFKILRIDPKSSSDKMPREFFSQKVSTDLKYYVKRDLTTFYRLKAGTYLLVPFTTAREKDLVFVLRTYLKSRDCAEELGDTQSKALIMKPEENVEEQLFYQYANEDLKINASHLQRFLNDVMLKDNPACLGGGGFSLDASRAILAAMDSDVSGMIEWKEFRRLWGNLRLFKDIFRKNDITDSGFLDKSAFLCAVQTTGHVMSKEMVKLIFQRYCDSLMRMPLIDFLCCMIRFKATSKLLRLLPREENGIYLTSEQFLHVVMYS
ncbi:calpain-13-like [Ambystoma mexicanum]|uniref:calpain-13-like n=1 Tax=Ambystoma mexicanum TaxID=8296 RepID=UPI0037E97D70